MSSTARYEMLPTEEVDAEESEASDSRQQPEASETSAVTTAPIEQSDTPAAVVEANSASNSDVTENVAEPASSESALSPLLAQPPPYNVAIDLPTYEEAERAKEEEAQREEMRERERRQNTPLLARLFPTSAEEEQQLGTDACFICAFLVAFVFSWLGALAVLCVTRTVAGRLGAMSGFGLNLVKLIAIMKNSEWGNHVAANNSLLWWVCILLGFLVFFRGATQYIRIKFHWHRLDQATRNNIFYYF